MNWDVCTVHPWLRPACGTVLRRALQHLFEFRDKSADIVYGTPLTSSLTSSYGYSDRGVGVFSEMNGADLALQKSLVPSRENFNVECLTVSLYVKTLPVRTEMVLATTIFRFFFWPRPQQAEVPRPGIEPASHEGQCQILNPRSHQRAPIFWYY